MKNVNFQNYKNDQVHAPRRLQDTSFFKFVGLLIAVTLFTWLPAVLDFQYRTISIITPAESPSVPPFIRWKLSISEISQSWVISGAVDNVNVDGPGVQLARKTPQRTIVSQHYPLPSDIQESGHLIRVTMRWSAAKESSTEATSQSGAAITEPSLPLLIHGWYSDREGSRISRHNLQTVDRPGQQRVVSQLFSIPDDATQFDISLMQRNNRLTVDIHRIEITRIAETRSFRVFHSVLVLLWLAVTAITFRFLVTRLNRPQIVATTGLLAVIVAGVLLSEYINYEIILPVYRWLVAFVSNANDPSTFYLYKIGHALFFGLLTLALLLQQGHLQLGTCRIVLLMLILAIATEGLQLTLFYRSPRLWDVAADLFGVIVAISLVRGCHYKDSCSASAPTVDQ